MSRQGIALAAACAVLASIAAPATAGSQGGWHYVLVGVSGSDVWQYSSGRGTGIESVAFRGARRGGELRGVVSATAQNSNGCTAASRSRSASFAPVEFVLHSTFVAVTWNFPSPRGSRCYLGTIRDVAARFRSWGMLSQDIPLSRFRCPEVRLNLGGRAFIPQGSTTGAFTFRANLVLKQA